MSRDNGTTQKKRRQSLARLPDEKRKEIFALAGLGYSIRQIARDVDIPRATLQRWFLGPLAAELGKVIEETRTLRAEMIPPTPLSPQEQEQRVCALLDAGQEHDVIASELNVSLMFVKVMARIRSAMVACNRRPASR